MKPPILLAIAAGLCWGIGEVCTRSALHGGRIGPIGAITARSLVAIPLLLLVFWLMTRGVAGLRVEPSLAKLDGATAAKVVLGSGLVAGGLAMVLFYTALSLGEVSVVKPIAFSIAPAVGVVLGWLVLGEPMSARKALAVGLILTGVVVLTTGGAGAKPAERTANPAPAESAAGAGAG
jgi:transporter family protein